MKEKIKIKSETWGGSIVTIDDTLKSSAHGKFMKEKLAAAKESIDKLPKDSSGRIIFPDRK